MNACEILDLFGTFISSYSADEKDAISQSQSQQFRDF